MVKHGEHRRNTERSEYPYDAERTGTDHGADGGSRRMTAAAQYARRYLIQITYRLIEQDAHYAYSRAQYHGGVVREQPGEKAAEQNGGENRDRAAYDGQTEAAPQDLAAASELTCGVVLAREGRRRLTESGDDVIGEVLKIHSDGAPRDSRLAEAVDRCLHEDVRKAEHRALYGGGDSGFKDFPYYRQGYPRTAQAQTEQLIFCQPPQHEPRRKQGRDIRRDGDAGHAHPEHDHEEHVQPNVHRALSALQQERLHRWKARRRP